MKGPVELKIKLKHLAEEARIIRKEEWRLKAAREYRVLNNIHAHRIHVVRPESRATHLAYGFLRGQPLSLMEAHPLTEPSWDRVESMALKYGTQSKTDLKETLKRWRRGETLQTSKTLNSSQHQSAA